MRARARGFNCYGVCAAHMEHGFGERRLALRWMPDRGIPFREPLRHYYIFRNALLLMRRSYVPARWKLNELKRLLLLMLAYVSSAPAPLRQLRCMLRGALHGLAGRSGPAPADLQR
jgi:rhamnosyltransferase